MHGLQLYGYSFNISSAAKFLEGGLQRGGIKILCDDALPDGEIEIVCTGLQCIWVQKARFFE